MWYLSPVTHGIRSQYDHCFGAIMNSNGGSINKRIQQGVPWMLDNGVYTKQGFIEEKWLLWMERLQEYAWTCVGIVVPDVVGDSKATLEKFPKYRESVVRAGYPIVFVSQDGLTVKQTPWNDFDVLFVGGSNEHKLGQEAYDLINEAKKRKKWIHVGRVNTIKRMRMFWMVDSVDGTKMTYDGQYSVHLGREVLAARQKKRQRKLLSDFDEETQKNGLCNLVSDSNCIS